MNNTNKSEKKELARILYMQGQQQKHISESTGISQQTITKWVKDGNWEAQKAAQNITRPELVNKLLSAINKILDQVSNSDDPTAIGGLSDKLSKFASVIEKLDKKANIVDAIEVFMAFNKWIQYRQSFDKEITPELIKAINKYQDLYISEHITK
ncbi:MAG TPA: terminase [Bacteroidales bacterium]|jgi:transcriptional regulator with XRE-family HTH domain|nr:terminase [Bacteroidales bacterium]